MKIIATILFYFLAVGTVNLEPKDEFVGTVVAEWLPGGRSMKILNDFAYIDPNGKEWKVPKGTVVDGASIPKAFWSIIGGPFEGEYRNASVVHDYYCYAPYKESWQDVHRMFYNACLTGGVSTIKAKIMYMAVYAGGPRWEKKWIKRGPGNSIEEMTFPVEVEAPQDKLEGIAKWIEANDPDLQTLTDSLDTVVKKVPGAGLPYMKP